MTISGELSCLYDTELHHDSPLEMELLCWAKETRRRQRESGNEYIVLGLARI